MRQAQLVPAVLRATEKPHCISIGAGTTVSTHMPDADECGRYGLTPGAPVLVVTRPGGEQLIAPGALTSVVLGDLADPLPADQARDAALAVLGVIGEELANTRALVTHLAAALRQSPGSVAALADDCRNERETEATSTGATLVPGTAYGYQEDSSLRP